MVPPVAAQGYVVYAGQGCTTLAVSSSQRAAGGRRERMCGWWKCAGSMFRMFRAKARPALCGSYGSACSGGRPARLLAAHVDLLADLRSEEHTSELQSLMRISYAVFCLKKKKDTTNRND